MGRKVIDCREYEQVRLDGSQCTILIAGEEDQLFDEAISHARTAHGMEDTPELREMTRKAMKDESRVTV